MSVHVMDWVWKHSESRLGQRLVLLAIADNASSDGTNAWPSIREICNKCGMSVRAVQDAIQKLMDLGELAVDPGTGPRRVNLYKVEMDPERQAELRANRATEKTQKAAKEPAESAPPTPQDLHPAESAPPQNLHADPAESDSSTPQNLHADPAESASPIRNRPEPSVEPSREPSGSELTLRDDVVVDAEVVEDAPTAQTLVSEWIDNCRTRPPKDVIGQIAAHVGSLLAEGYDYGDVRRAVQAWQSKGLHPRTLSSVFNEVVNVPTPNQRAAGSTPRPSTADQRSYTGQTLTEKYLAEGN